MFQIPIRKNNLSTEQAAGNLKVDLRDSKQEGKQKQSLKSWLFLGIFLALIIVFSGINYWFSVSQKEPFADLIPQEVVVYSLINLADFYPQIFPFKQYLQERNFFGQGAINKLNDYFNQAQLSFVEDIQPLFKDQAVFILLPANSETPLPFLVIFERKGSLVRISQILDKIEPELNKDFNLSSQDYRQIEITMLNPLFSSFSQCFYASIENYFIISNSQESLKKTIDSIIDN
jgi:hypothetical protein